jgi:general secretion pathway protein G
VITVLPTGKGAKVKKLFAGIIATVFVALYASSSHCRPIWEMRESVLRQDLYVMRSAIDQYTLDKQKAPQSLQDLVCTNYLKQVPVDPMTRSSDTWEIVQEDSLMAIDQARPGIIDIHSASHEKAKDGTAYNTW